MRDRKVVILGLGRQGMALARYLVRMGAEVTVSDVQEEAALAGQLNELAGLPIRYVLGGHPSHLLDNTDLLCVSGGVPLRISIVEEAKERGIPLTNDAQLFLDRCPAPVIGITGSAGKTTTTALVGEMCRVASLRTWVGGNIGNPLISDIENVAPSDCVVMELSSFQLEAMTSSPHIAAVLNLTPNHLDRHQTMQAYVAAKKNILVHQTEDDVALLGYDDANARALALETPGKLFFFSGGAEVEAGAFKTNGELTLRMGGCDREVCKVSDVQLLGRHNLLNVLAASVLATLAGAPLEAIRNVATTFSGVSHRLELVGEVGAVRWYDDSIATAPERAVAALRSFDDPIVLLAGGRDKALPWDTFAEETVRRARWLITFGESGEMIAQEVEAAIRRDGDAMLAGITRVTTLSEAVHAASELATSGDVVLLSPGGTSFDAFRDFAERGERFQQLVRELQRGQDS